jgi:hypothetical protein
MRCTQDDSGRPLPRHTHKPATSLGFSATSTAAAEDDVAEVGRGLRLLSCLFGLRSCMGLAFGLAATAADCVGTAATSSDFAGTAATSSDFALLFHMAHSCVQGLCRLCPTREVHSGESRCNT